MSELISFASLDRNPFIALTTYRKNGTPVMTPVWFVKQDGKLFVWTAADSCAFFIDLENPGAPAHVH
jgi:PPOX class probable F420-dependent enzyme